MNAEPGSIIDSAALDRLRGSVGDEFVGELVATFLGDAPAQLAALRGAVERGDAEEARRAAHTLKSNGATFGAERLLGALPSTRGRRRPVCSPAATSSSGRPRPSTFRSRRRWPLLGDGRAS